MGNRRRFDPGNENHVIAGPSVAGYYAKRLLFLAVLIVVAVIVWDKAIQDKIKSGVSGTIDSATTVKKNGPITHQQKEITALQEAEKQRRTTLGNGQRTPRAATTQPREGGRGTAPKQTPSRTRGSGRGRGRGQ